MILSDDALEKYRIAGRIAREVREAMKSFVREGMQIIEVCERAETLIQDKGAQPAFPCNVSVNEVAAHYTSPPRDRSIIPKNSIVKIDVGAHIDGYIADTAVTICFNRQFENLVRTAEAALKVAVGTIHSGISTSRLGSTIEKTINTYGCKPVSNLTGHQIGLYLIHTGKSLPNVSHLIGSKIREGEVLAIEPFVTSRDAAGRVKDGDEATIFRFLKRKSLKNNFARHLLDYCQSHFRTLPFAERWLKDIIPSEYHDDAFRELLHTKCLTSYYTFVETSGRPVAQAEHTLIVTADGCIVLTK